MSSIGRGLVQGMREVNCSTPANESVAKLELIIFLCYQIALNSIWKVGLYLLTGGGKALLGNLWGRQGEVAEVINHW